MSNQPANMVRSFGQLVARSTLATILALSLSATANAQNAEELVRQQKEAMRQYMEAAGMGEEEIAKIEAQAENAMAPLVGAQAAEEAREQAQFEAGSAGLGKAVISMAGRQVELPITECVLKENGDWSVAAQDRANSNSSLSIGGDSYYKRNVLWMRLKDVGAIEGAYIQPMVPMKDGQVNWTGTVNAEMFNGNSGETPVSVTINCEAGS